MDKKELVKAINRINANQSAPLRGSDIVSATNAEANNLGAYRHVTGSVTIATLSTFEWVDGSEVEMYFVDGATVTHNAVTVPRGTLGFKLVGAVDYVVPAGGKLRVRLDI